MHTNRFAAALTLLLMSAAPGQAQIVIGAGNNHGGSLGPILAHNEQGHTMPANTSTMPGQPPLPTALLSVIDRLPALGQTAVPNPLFAEPVLSMPRPALLRSGHAPVVSITSVTAPNSAPAVPAPGAGPLLLLAAAATIGRRRR